MFSTGSYFRFTLSLPFCIYLSFSSSFSCLFLLACLSIWLSSTSWNSASPKRPFCKSPITYDHGLIKCTNMKKPKPKDKAVKSISSRKSSAHRLMLSGMSEAPGVILKRTNYFYFHPWQNLQSQHLSSNLWIPSVRDVSPSPQLGYSAASLILEISILTSPWRDLCPDQPFLAFFFFPPCSKVWTAASHSKEQRSPQWVGRMSPLCDLTYCRLLIPDCLSSAL